MLPTLDGLCILLLLSLQCSAEKEIFLFFNKSESILNIKNTLLQLSNDFTAIMESIEFDENNICQKIPYDVVSDDGQTALIVNPSNTLIAPNCPILYPHGGNVMFTFTTPSGFKYGSIFDGERGAKLGSTKDLVDHLNKITTEGDLINEVGDTYVGVKKQVSLLDNIYVPAIVIALLIALLVMSILTAIVMYVKKLSLAKKNRAKLVKPKPEDDKNFSMSATSSKSQTSKSHSKSKSRKTKSEGTDLGETSVSAKSDASSKKRKVTKALTATIKSKAKEKEILPKQRDQSELVKEPVTSTEFESYLNSLARFAIEYYDNPTAYNVTPDVKPGFLYNKMPKVCPQNPESFKTIFDDFKNQIVSGLTHWQHPNFFAYYPTGRAYPDILADFITSALSVIGVSWDSCPALAELEHAMVNWVGRALGIPETFLFQDSPESSQGGGTLTESGSDAIFCALLAARQWKINQVVEEQQHTGVIKFRSIYDIAKRLVVYCSRDAHSAIEKGCKLAMLRCRAIQPLEENNWGLTGEQIQSYIEKDLKRDLIPCLISCTLGTTATASCDKLISICPVAKKYDAWLHVDADYAGSAFIVQKNREVAEGIENANTINVNLSKFLLHSATLSIIWTKNQKIYKDAFAITPMYLKSHGHVTDMRDWGLHLSRRFKALKVWFIMRICGVEGLRRHVIKICEMASYFETLVDQHPNLQIFTTRNFGVFTFHYAEPNLTKEEKNRHTIRLLRFFNESHKIFLTNSQVADNSVIRVSMSYERSTKQTIDKAFSVMKALVEEYKRRKDDPLLLKSQPAVPTFNDKDCLSEDDGELDMATQTAKLTASVENQGSPPPADTKVTSTALPTKDTEETTATKPQQTQPQTLVTKSALAARDQTKSAATKQMPTVPSKTASTLVVKRPPP